MPSVAARRFTELFRSAFEQGGPVPEQRLRELSAAKSAIRDEQEKKAAEKLFALVRSDRKLDRIEVPPSRRALAHLAGTPADRLPADLERMLHHAVPGANVELSHYDLSFDLSRDRKEFPAQAVLTLKKPAPDEVVLEVDPTRLSIGTVRVSGRRASFRVEGERLFVDAKGAKRIDVRYTVRPTERVGGHGLIRDRSSGTITTLTWPYATSSLFPSSSAPADGVTARIRVKVRRGARVIGANADAKGVLHIDRPVPSYAIGFYAGRFTKLRPIESKSGVEVEVLGHGDSVRRSVRHAYQKAAADAIDFFGGWLGPYPYGQKLELVEVKGDLGGMENAGAVALMVGSIRGVDDACEVAVHETAHHWFGDNLRIKDGGEFWMSEGFTNYLTYRFLESKEGRKRFIGLLDNAKEEIRAGLRKRDHALEGPAYTDLNEIFTDIPYQLGAWVLRMIETELGRPRFDELLARWYRAHRFSPVDTKEFVDFLNHETGRDFAPFFHDWKRLETIPPFRDRSRIDGRRVTVRLQSKAEIPAGLRIPLVIEGRGGEKKTVLIDPRTTVTLEPSFSVKRLIWDPDRQVLADVGDLDK